MIPPGCGKKRRVRGLFYQRSRAGKGLETGWEKKQPKEKSIFYKKRQKSYANTGNMVFYANIHVVKFDNDVKFYLLFIGIFCIL